MTFQLIRQLDDGPIDIVGDVHGHLPALRRLLDLLGYDACGCHPAGRRLVFVGDLCDRGPDSPGVFELVMTAVEEGGAVALLGNHELALIDTDEHERQKAGNAWFFGDPAKCRKDEADFGPFRQASAAQRARIEAFCDALPLAVERPDLQVVHACWDAASLDFVRASRAGSSRDLIAASNAQATAMLEEAGLTSRFAEAKAILEGRRRVKGWAPDEAVTDSERVLIEDLRQGEYLEQQYNPVRVLTSGKEWPAPVPRWLGKKWRFLDRVPWWRDAALARPTVFGHYWRQREHLPLGPYDEHLELFGRAGPEDWVGPARLALCVDYRWPQDWGRPALGAYRPDLAELVFWDGVRVPSRWGEG